MLDQSITEARFVDHIISYLAIPFGWLVHHDRAARTDRGWRTAIQGHAGFPDLVLTPGPLTREIARAEANTALAAGRTAAIAHTLYRECKTNTGRLDPAQEAWIAALEAAGEDVTVWRPRNYPTIVHQLTFGRWTVRQPGTHEFTPTPGSRNR